MNAMTDAQKDAADKIHTLMTEHFDCGIAVLCYEYRTQDDHAGDSIKVDYTGGYASARGLLDIGREYLRRAQHDPIQ